MASPAASAASSGAQSPPRATTGTPSAASSSSATIQESLRTGRLDEAAQLIQAFAGPTLLLVGRRLTPQACEALGSALGDISDPNSSLSKPTSSEYSAAGAASTTTPPARSRLVSLSLERSRIDDAGAEALCTGLRRNMSVAVLDLQYTSLSPTGAASVGRLLAEKPSLTWLRLGGNELSASGAESIATGLRASSTGNSGDADAAAAPATAAGASLASNLPRQSCLTSLDLRYCGLGPKGARAIADALRVNSTLTSLNLCYNGCRAEGAAALADALGGQPTESEVEQSGQSTVDTKEATVSGGKATGATDATTTSTTTANKNNVLSMLYLAGNAVGAAGAAALGKALASNNSLTVLDLGGNALAHDGAAALASNLQANSTLTTLYLGGNGIGAPGARAIGQLIAVKPGPPLRTLYLDGNGLRPSHLVDIASGLATNATLRALHLNENNFGRTGSAKILRAVRGNRRCALRKLVGVHLDRETLMRSGFSRLPSAATCAAWAALARARAASEETEGRGGASTPSAAGGGSHDDMDDLLAADADDTRLEQGRSSSSSFDGAALADGASEAEVPLTFAQLLRYMWCVEMRYTVVVLFKFWNDVTSGARQGSLCTLVQRGASSSVKDADGASGGGKEAGEAGEAGATSSSGLVVDGCFMQSLFLMPGMCFVRQGSNGEVCGILREHILPYVI